MPTPYISADYIRDPSMTSVHLLSKAPPSARRSVRQLSEDEGSQRTKQVSSLRSTVSEEVEEVEEEEEERNRMESPEAMSEGGEDELEEEGGGGGRGEGPYHIHGPVRSDSLVLPPINRVDVSENGSSSSSLRTLPSLRSMLSPSTADVQAPLPMIDSPPTLSLPYSPSASSSSSTSLKRSTPSRQFYPSLASLASSMSTSTKQDTSNSEPKRLTTGENLDRITEAVDSFNMSSIDDDRQEAEEEEEEVTEAETNGRSNESDDDISNDAIYKRCRLRTISPLSMASQHFEDNISYEEDGLELHMGRSTGDEAPVMLISQEQSPKTSLQIRRLAVIQALMSRANELYRNYLAAKPHPNTLTVIRDAA